ncbi:ABC transporter substrate-binding protein [Cetobacterium ceti]
MKKFILSSLLLSIAVMVTGCGSEKQENGKKTLKLALWDANQKPVIEEILKKYEEKNPNVKIIVEITPFSQYWTKLETAATGGQLQDIFWINAPHFKKYVQGNMLLPLDDLVESKKIESSKFPQGMIKMYTYNKKLYAAPKDIDTTALWYNKDIFNKYNIDLPNENWTWENMIDAAKEIKVKSGLYGLAFSFEGQEDYYEIVSQFGGRILSEDKKTSGYGMEETKNAIGEIQNLIKEGVIPTLEEVADTKSSDLFQSEKVAMTYSGSWMITPYMKNEIINKKIDIAKLPIKKKDAAIIHGLGYGIYSKTKYPEIAKEVVTFLSSKTAHDIQGKSGIVIPARIDSQKLWENSYENLNLKGYSKMLPNGIEYPASLNTAKWEEIQREYLNKVWLGEMDAPNACDEINKKINEILASEN